MIFSPILYREGGESMKCPKYVTTGIPSFCPVVSTFHRLIWQHAVCLHFILLIWRHAVYLYVTDFGKIRLNMASKVF